MNDNLQAALRLSEYADLLEEQGIEYKPRAYRRASEKIQSHGKSVRELAIEGATEKIAADIDDVGEPIARIIAKDLIDN